MGLGIDAIHNFMTKPVTEREAGGAGRVNFFTNPGTIPPLTGAGFTEGITGNGTGELQADYGDGGASGAAYKGINHGTVGAKFDTNRLGIYGF